MATLAELDRQIEEAVKEEERLLSELENEHSALKLTENRLSDLKNSSEMEASLRSKFNESELVEIHQLVEQADSIESRESDYVKSCEQTLLQLAQDIEQLQNSENVNDGVSQVLQEDMESVQSTLARLRLELAVVARNVAHVQRQIDSIPSQLEMIQYQQRFIELYNQMASQHRLTKQYISLYNSLIDVRNYMKKEIDMMSNIEDSLPALNTDANKANFIHRLQEILKSVEASYDKMVADTKRLENSKHGLKSELSNLKDVRRKFLQTADNLQLECQRNDHLQKLLTAHAASN